MKISSSSYRKFPKVFSGNKEVMQFHIRDFANLKQEAGESIQTNSVKAHGHLWKLHLYLGGTSATKYVDFYMIYQGENSHSNRVVAKVMIRTETCSSEVRRFDFSTDHACMAIGEEFLGIDDDCNDDGTLTIFVELEIATEKNPVWFPRLLTNGDNNNIGAQLYRSVETTSDVTFLIGTSTSRKEFKVHRCIIELRAKSLYELILTEEESNSNNKDGNDSTIIALPDTEEKVFDVFLVFVYTGKEPELNKDDEDIAKSILRAANRYGCTDLKLYIESVLVKTFLLPSNAAALLLLADSYSCALLKEAAMKIYITCNTEDTDDFDVTSLRERLEKANLDVDGSRQILVERWKTYLRPGNEVNENQNKRQRIE
ncbi:hypothetical protein FRACYDRAFT_251325 [Fragilariopsis cylindrus CCMP1102]|uniref:POZ domain-containing protein n=1 Tax=Fragilariopsis cylindrus CCMP1102 TaxID=635003 RepID=A0A1E7EMS8_9STRA|nr:hypothetical protein FRACYDRAFT_251325 [Fragilariopsis cylindrus CCMP1102]|eukprot:OEU07252.1 hypothetical protein FRACYDRAFT_251325 [Fragilariopsis cylindrus CCMP1102]